jgi:uncharacterized membrane protein YozB (DUF420 family)
MPHPLVHVNAALNTLATVLLVLAYVFIKLRKEKLHRNAMWAALAASGAFLACYLYYHFVIRLTVPFTHAGVVRYVYYTILLTHVLLAMTVPFLAFWSAWLGTQALATGTGPTAGAGQSADFRQRHRRVVRWAFPIWLYVSVTGVLIYLMLYIWFPPIPA